MDVAQTVDFDLFCQYQRARFGRQLERLGKRLQVRTQMVRDEVRGLETVHAPGRRRASLSRLDGERES